MCIAYQQPKSQEILIFVCLPKDVFLLYNECNKKSDITTMLGSIVDKQIHNSHETYLPKFVTVHYFYQMNFY